MNIFYRTLQTIKSASFFGMATESMHNGNTNNIKENMQNKSIPRKVLYSGLILSVNIALLGKAIYNKVRKKLKNKQKNNKEDKLYEKVRKNRPDLQDENENSNLVPLNNKAHIDDDLRQLTNNNVDKNNMNENKFYYDSPLSESQIERLKKLKTFNLIDNNKDFPNSIILESNTNKERFKLIINKNGIFTKEHNLLLSNNDTLANLSLFIIDKNDIFYNDLCKIYLILKISD